MYGISKCLLLAEVLVLVGEFLHHFQGVGLDVFLEHLRGGVAGDLHDVVRTAETEFSQQARLRFLVYICCVTLLEGFGQFLFRPHWRSTPASRLRLP